MNDINTSEIYIKNIISVSHDIYTHHWKHHHLGSTNTYEIYFHLNGESSYKGDADETPKINKTNAFSYKPPKNYYFAESITVPTEILGVYFEAEIPENSENNIFLNVINLQNCNDSVRNAFENINHYFLLKQPDWQLNIRKEMYKIFSIVLNKIRVDNLDNCNYYIIRTADKYIKANYLKEDISIEYLAELCNITPSYFTRIFKNVFGTSPKKYIINLKMQAACEYLYFTATPIKEIAEILGYSEVAYFTTSFKKYYGISPLEYRKNHITNILNDKIQ